MYSQLGKEATLGCPRAARVAFSVLLQRRGILQREVLWGTKMGSKAI